MRVLVHVLIFVKFYDETSRTLNYIGHKIVRYDRSLRRYSEIFRILIGLPQGTQLRAYIVRFGVCFKNGNFLGSGSM